MEQDHIRAHPMVRIAKSVLLQATAPLPGRASARPHVHSVSRKVYSGIYWHPVKVIIATGKPGSEK
jgi:hypothetical protein